MPKVTVVLPVWNAAPYLTDAVNSILTQDFNDFELLAIDDGSTDGSLDILHGLRDPRLRILSQPVNMGIAAASNLGLELASGEYVARMDSDDVAAPDRLRRQVDLMDEEPGIAVCGGKMDVFGTYQGHAACSLRDPAIKARFLLGAGNILNPTSMLRRSFAMEHRLRYNPAYLNGSDLAFWIDCMRAGATFANIDAVLVRYRRHRDNVTAKRDILKSSVLRIRRGLAADFFPNLTGAETEALAQLFVEPARRAPLDLARHVAAALKAKDWTHSQYGEDRNMVASIIDKRVQDVVAASSNDGNPS